jgi:chemotaxis protein MotA
MDLATLIGLGAGTAVVLLAILMDGDFTSFVNVPSLLIVIGGAGAVTVLRFTLADVVTALKTGISAALGQSKSTPRMLIQEISGLPRPPGRLRGAMSKIRHTHGHCAGRISEGACR